MTLADYILSNWNDSMFRANMRECIISYAKEHPEAIKEMQSYGYTAEAARLKDYVLPTLGINNE